eukprot:s3482_g2.t1
MWQKFGRREEGNAEGDICKEGASEEGEGNSHTGTVLGQRLVFLRDLEGVQKEARGRPSKASACRRHVTNQLSLWLDVRRPGMYQKVEDDLHFFCTVCRVKVNGVRETTIAFILQHECCDKHWFHVHAQHAPRSSDRGLCEGIPLRQSTGTLAHSALEHFKLWLDHGAPWHLSIQHRCFAKEIGTEIGLRREDGTPVVRSAACAEKQGYNMQGSSHCTYCLKLADRKLFVDKVTWWGEKIKLTNLATFWVAGEVPDCHRSYADIRKDIATSIGSIPPPLQNRAAKLFIESRVKALPRDLPAKERHVFWFDQS